MTNKVITVAFNKSKPTKKGTTMWSIKSEDGDWYNVFDQDIADELTTGSTKTIAFETNESGFHNVKAVIHREIASDDFADFLTTDEPAPAPVAPVKAPTTSSALQREVTKLVGERTTAIECASLLVAHGKVPLENLGTMADTILRYLNGESIATEQKSSSGHAAQEFIK